MKLIVLSVRDRISEVFAQPFYAPTVGAGSRGFADEVNRSDSQLRKHPDDYDLYSLGIFDDCTGLVECLAGPTLICTGRSVLIKE